MTTLLNSFEGGSNGVTITGGNSGGTSGNAFTSVNTGVGATNIYDNTRAAHGVLSCQMATSGTSSTVYLRWDPSGGGTIPQIWFRQYLYFTADPAAQTVVFAAVNASFTCARLAVLATGQLRFLDASAGTILTTTNTIPLNQWFRIEGFVIGDPSVGQVSLSLYSSMDSTVPTEMITSAASQNTSTALTQIRLGASTPLSNAGPFWMDDVGVSDAGYLGPYIPSVPPAPVSVIMGTAAVPGSSTVPVFTLPAGLSNYTIFQPTGPQAVYLGSSARVSNVNGMAVPTTPISLDSYNTSGGATYYATTGNGTASSFCFIISTAN